MPVYMIRAGESGPVKIGVTKNALSRLKMLQTGCPLKLSFIRLLDGDEAEERSLHRRFATQRTSGEWFTFCDAMLTEDFGMIDVPFPSGIRDAVKSVKEIRTHEDAINFLGGPSDLARKLGIAAGFPPTLHWGRRGIPSRYWHHVRELIVAGGIPITDRDLAHMPTRGTP